MLSRRGPSVAFDRPHQKIEQGPLTLEQLRLRLSHGKPTHPVDFGILPDVSRSFRPLQLERVTERALEIEVAADGECGDALAARLPQRREVDARAVGRRLAELLEKLTLRDGPWVLAL